MRAYSFRQLGRLPRRLCRLPRQLGRLLRQLCRLLASFFRQLLPLLADHSGNRLGIAVRILGAWLGTTITLGQGAGGTWVFWTSALGLALFT